MKITPSILTLWHAILAVVLGSLLAAGLGFMQYVGLHGVVNVGEDVSYGLALLVGVLAALPVSIWHTIQLNPALPQAESDAISQVQQLAQRAINHAESLWTVVNSHTSALAAQKAATPVSTPINLSMPQNMTAGAQSVPSVPQLAFPTPAGVAPTGMITPQVNPQAFVLPSRDGMWNDSALMPAMPQPPRG